MSDKHERPMPPERVDKPSDEAVKVAVAKAREKVAPQSALAPDLPAEDQAAIIDANREAALEAARTARDEGLRDVAVAAHENAVAQGLAQVPPHEVGQVHTAPIGQDKAAVTLRYTEGTMHPGRWVQVSIPGDTVTLELDVPTEVSAWAAEQLMSVDSDNYTIEKA